MSTPTYDLLESVTLATAASSVTFSSIDQSYGDLILVVVQFQAGSSSSIRFNSDSGNNYYFVGAAGNGSSTISYNSSGSFLNPNYYTNSGATNPATYTYQIFDYAVTDKQKSVLVRTDQSDSTSEMWAGRWDSTAAISSILVGNGTFASGSTLNLYGVAK